MGRKCSVEGCLSESTRSEDTGVTFHKIPMHSDIRPKWLALCRIPDDKKTVKVIYICSRHFLRADFCGFKGKKYVLRQGVLPSVFPWDKSKLEALKHTPKKDDDFDPDKLIKKEMEESLNEQPNESSTETDEPPDEVKQEKPDDLATKKEEKNKNALNFAINSRIEVLDFNNVWYPARIIEEDDEENEVLIHFEKFSAKYDEWICRDSARLRPLPLTAATRSRSHPPETYRIGERCMAPWTDSRKFPATVNKILANETYQVLFDDGYVKNVKGYRLNKMENKPAQASPLFEPVQSTKQERRDKKRKLNIAALFRKKPKSDSDDRGKNKESSSADEDMEYEPWVPQWQDGLPIGIESSIESNDGTRKSYIVPDPRLPESWIKHLVQRQHGISAGKWETVIIGPDNRRFRTRSEIRSYLEETKLMKYNPTMFDFSVMRHRNRRKDLELDTPPSKSHTSPKLPAPPKQQSTMPKQLDLPPKQSDECDTPVKTESPSPEPEEAESKNCLKIPLVNDAYHCPIDGCTKTYRKENLAQMHVKHYHPEYVKYLDSTPNVADLAYARTVNDSLEKNQQKNTPKTLTKAKIVSPIQPISPSIVKKEEDLDMTKCEALKDIEIIKLLNTKSCDDQKEKVDIKPLPSGLPSDMYPDIKLKDLLTKSDDMPKRDHLNLKALSTTRPPMRIKTLLPVVRSEKRASGDEGGRMKAKKKKGSDEENGKETNDNAPDAPSTVSTATPPPTTPIDVVTTTNSTNATTTTATSTTPLPPSFYLPPTLTNSNNIIIEGGEIIKLVKMKQEEIINCICGYSEEDGLMVQCDLCLCWQHGYCINVEKESQVPEKYVCYICQNPLRQRLSKKHQHDQDWLKQGVLPTGSYHSTRDNLAEIFGKLKKSHDISGGLLELRDYFDTLKVKLKIAEVKNHPKLYLWSKPWDKLPLPENVAEDVKEESKSVDGDVEKPDEGTNGESMLMMILKGTKDKNDDTTTSAPIVPQPEAAIDSADCQLNLLDHLSHSLSLVEERLDKFEERIAELEDDDAVAEDCDDVQIKQTLQMLQRDLGIVQKLGQMTATL